MKKNEKKLKQSYQKENKLPIIKVSKNKKKKEKKIRNKMRTKRNHKKSD